MMLVLDASAAVGCATQAAAAAWILPHLETADSIVAPDLFTSEVTNAFWKLHRFGNVPLTHCELHCEHALQLPDRIIPTADFALEVFHFAASSQHPAYDLFYAVLTRRLSATLVTLDRKLRALCEQHGISCVAFHI